MTRRLLLLSACALLPAACTTLPAPLQGDYIDTLTPQAATQGDHSGSRVRWGGRIVNTEPGTDTTCFEMIATPLSADGRPLQRGDETRGRFIACRAGFYDPAVFKPERARTFTGDITGYESRRIGGYDYRLPRIAADVVYLWPQHEQVEVIAPPAPWPWWGYGWW